MLRHNRSFRPLLRLFSHRPSGPLWRYCVAVVPIAVFPSLLMAFAATALFAHLGIDRAGILVRPQSHGSVLEFVGLVVFAPVAETLLLALLLGGLVRLISNVWLAAAVSGLVFGAAHGVFGAVAFFGTVWSFFVFSIAFLAWRAQSFWSAFLAAAVPHAIMNACVLLFLPIVEDAV